MVGPSINSHNFPLKFLCSYGGKIMPRQTDGKLRYYGGESRILSFDRCILFAELLVKLGKMCGSSVSLRCQFPSEDLDALVSITSDEDLVNLIEEYDRASTPSSSLKIRAFLLPPKSTKKFTTISNPDFTSPNSFSSRIAIPSSTVASLKHHDYSRTHNKMAHNSFDQCETFNGRIRHIRTISSPVMFPIFHVKVAANIRQYAYLNQRNNSSHVYLIHHGNHWQ
ncbi:unnamed protein product [Withania somnifera]